MRRSRTRLSLHPARDQSPESVLFPLFKGPGDAGASKNRLRQAKITKGTEPSACFTDFSNASILSDPLGPTLSALSADPLGPRSSLFWRETAPRPRS